MKENSFLHKIKEGAKTAVKIGTVAAITAFPIKETTGQTTTQDTLDTKKTEHIEAQGENYITTDGNFRYYHNPSSEGKISYSYGTTQSPYETMEDMKNNTIIPKSLTETDFFTNYVNAKLQSNIILTDAYTGNKYYDYHEFDSSLNEVPFSKPGEHFNIQRFLIQPAFYNFDISQEKARENALYDIYKYFLVLEKGDRDSAWEKATAFIENEIDPIVQGEFMKWHKENSQISMQTFNLFTNGDKTSLPETILEHNKKVFEGQEQGKVYSREELKKILVDYNIHFRKKTAEEAERIAENSIASQEQFYKDQIESVKNRPVTEYKVLKAPQYPEGYSSWSEDEQMIWRQENPDLLGEYQESFTEEDRNSMLTFLNGYRFVN